MRLDCHIHVIYGEVKQKELLDRLHQSGIDGGIILSQGPSWFYDQDVAPKQRIENVLEWTAGEKYLFPFYFMDPTEEDAIEQVELANRMGVCGIKVICTHHYPGDPRAMKTYQRAADLGMPILFHSGILYDGKNASGNYNRPCNFEPLMSISGLRFALAHISWPWTDECIAVYGKFNNSLKKGGSAAAGAEMFIDITPGTPAVYRRSAFERLLTVPYDHENNIIFGSDCRANFYSVERVTETQQRDDRIYEELGISKERQEKIYCKNLLRFVGHTGD